MKKGDHSLSLVYIYIPAHAHTFSLYKRLMMMMKASCILKTSSRINAASTHFLANKASVTTPPMYTFKIGFPRAPCLVASLCDILLRCTLIHRAQSCCYTFFFFFFLSLSPFSSVFLYLAPRVESG